MKKFLGIIVLGLLLSSNAYAECKGNCVNGQGTMEWSNGDKYVGEWKDGKIHGKGTMKWSNGDKYVGEWKKGEMHGEGTMEWSDGYKYTGEWKKGEMHGEVSSELVKKETPVGTVIWQEKYEDNINECKILEIDPAKIYFANLNWNYEEKNISRKRYVYRNQKNLTFRKIKDPSALKEIRFIKLTSGKKIKGIKGLPRDRNTNKMKMPEIEYHAYIYYVTYAKCDFGIEFRVHDKFKREKADELVKKYAYMFGQIPFFLRHGYELTRSYTEHFRTKRVTILPEARSSFANVDDAGFTFTLHPEADSKIFYTLIHEAAHAGFERNLLNSRKWFNAVKADNVYITKYARTNPSEDIAETVAFWMSIRCYKDKVKAKRILKKIPNRIKFLDELNLNTYPLVCK